MNGLQSERIHLRTKDQKSWISRIEASLVLILLRNEVRSQRHFVESSEMEHDHKLMTEVPSHDCGGKISCHT